MPLASLGDFGGIPTFVGVTNKETINYVIIHAHEDMCDIAGHNINCGYPVYK